MVIVGVMVAIGIVLSFYGNQVIFQDLAKEEGEVSFGQELIIEIELDQEQNDNGIYAVQILSFKEGVFSAEVYDPLGIKIDSQSINEEVFEGSFDIFSSGKYQLVIKSTDQESTKIFGVIGPEPDAGAKSIGFISLYILVIGLIGMAGVGIYAIKNRKK
ncbi:hypothetical protein [Nitrosopumilus sp. K4]|uniref:hypothetical protein n=1 Tax=Nitrosopumilus sp. K4 TaxID=2795383 RepID=UPI0020113505|nr:hypothetical protein [Nitrosopumilus sp. K4]